MNKFFKLVWVNLLGLFDINKILVARSEGVKSNLEKKTIITGIIAVIYGFILYRLFIWFNFEDKFLILSLGFLISSLLCFFMNLFIIEPIILKNNDNEMLFSLPVTITQILFSKLFIIYLRNMLFVSIIMISSFLSYGYFVKDMGDTFVLMGIISTLIIPLIPIVLSTIVVYVNDYFKIRSNNSKLFKICRSFIILLVILGIIFLFSGIRSNDVNEIFSSVVSKGHLIYFVSWLFDKALSTTNLFWFLILIGISFVTIYLYTLIVSNNYLRICSLLKGHKKSEAFVYKKNLNLHSFFGMVRKEIIYLFNNKFYLFNSYGIMFLFSVLLFVAFNLFDISRFYEIENFKFYLNLYVPTLLVLFVNMSGSAVSSVSLEKKNIDILRTMPISMAQILGAKWLINVLIGSVFVIVNGSIVWYYLDLSKWSVMFSYLIPFVSLMFISLVAIILDYRFIEKVETDDNAIIKQRFIGMVPPFLAIIIGIGPLFIAAYKMYKLLLGSYVLAMCIGMIICLIYLLISREKLLENLNKN